MEHTSLVQRRMQWLNVVMLWPVVQLYLTARIFLLCPSGSTLAGAGIKQVAGTAWVQFHKIATSFLLRSVLHAV